MKLLRAGLLLGALALTATTAQAVPEAKTERPFNRDGHIHGYLVDASGRGLRGVVALATPDGQTISLHHTNGMRRGRFDIDNIFAGTYLLKVQTVGPYPTDLVPPPPKEVRVERGRVARPVLIAPTRHIPVPEIPTFTFILEP